MAMKRGKKRGQSRRPASQGRRRSLGRRRRSSGGRRRASSAVYPPLTRTQKLRASLYIPEMIREWKAGRWRSRGQAIAVALSKARRG